VTPDAWPRRVAIVGAGTMGSGIAEVLSGAGIATALVDAAPGAADRGRDGAVSRARAAEARGHWPAGTGDHVASCLTAATSIATAVADADLVLEVVTEDPTVKAAVYAQIEAAAPATAVLASNTSALPIGALAGSLARPERFLGVHWFNPPQWTPGVEVIPHAGTDPAVAEDVRSALAGLGKVAAIVGDGPGFVGNRIQFAMFREAAAVVAEGLATPEAVDDVVRSTFGFRLPLYGPFRIADMAGLDVYAGAYAALEEHLGERMSAPPEVTAHVAAGRTGTKAGAGYYEHDPATRDADLERRDVAYAALRAFLVERGAA